MNHQDLEILVSRSLDEPLDEAERAILDRALAESPELRELECDLHRLRQLATAVPVPCAPPLAAELMQRVEDKFAPSKPVGAWRWLGLAAAVLAAMAIGSVFWQPSEGDEAGEAFVWDATAHLEMEARQRFHRNVTPLEVFAIERLSDLPADAAHGYAQSLIRINRELAHLEQVNLRYPGHPSPRMALDALYQSKLALLNQIAAG